MWDFGEQSEAWRERASTYGVADIKDADGTNTAQSKETSESHRNATKAEISTLQDARKAEMERRDKLHEEWVATRGVGVGNNNGGAWCMNGAETQAEIDNMTPSQFDSLNARSWHGGQDEWLETQSQETCDQDVPETSQQVMLGEEEIAANDEFPSDNSLSQDASGQSEDSGAVFDNAEMSVFGDISLISPSQLSAAASADMGGSQDIIDSSQLTTSGQGSFSSDDMFSTAYMGDDEAGTEVGLSDAEGVGGPPRRSSMSDDGIPRDVPELFFEFMKSFKMSTASNISGGGQWDFLKRYCGVAYHIFRKRRKREAMGFQQLRLNLLESTLPAIRSDFTFRKKEGGEASVTMNRSCWPEKEYPMAVWDCAWVITFQTVSACNVAEM